MKMLKTILSAAILLSLIKLIYWYYFEQDKYIILNNIEVDTDNSNNSV